MSSVIVCEYDQTSDAGRWELPPVAAGGVEDCSAHPDHANHEATMTAAIGGTERLSRIREL